MLFFNTIKTAALHRSFKRNYCQHVWQKAMKEGLNLRGWRNVGHMVFFSTFSNLIRHIWPGVIHVRWNLTNLPLCPLIWLKAWTHFHFHAQPKRFFYLITVFWNCSTRKWKLHRFIITLTICVYYVSIFLRTVQHKQYIPKKY